MKWNAAYTVKTDGAEMTSTVQFDAQDFEEAMNVAMDRKNVFKDGADVRISSLREMDCGRRPIGFGEC